MKKWNQKKKVKGNHQYKNESIQKWVKNQVPKKKKKSTTSNHKKAIAKQETKQKTLGKIWFKEAIKQRIRKIKKQSKSDCKNL